jgi:heat shock protein HslJ
MLRPHSLRLAALLTLVLLLLGACSGSEDDGADTTLAPTTTTVESTTTAATTTTTLPPTTTEPAAPVEAPELADTSWNVINYRLPDGTITNVWKTDVTISFSADGTVSGSAGCNVYEGTWSVSGAWDAFESGVPDSNDGQELILDSLSWTEMACEDDAIMEQEAEILDLLQDAGRWVLIRGEFNLRDAEGGFLFSAEPV